MNKSFIAKVSVILGLSFILLALESLIKYYYILNKIPKEGFYFFYRLIQISLYPNTKAAFSLPLPQIAIIILVSIILLVLLYVWILAFKRQNILELLAVSLLMVGAISNLLDRLLYGYVIDYLNVFIWPVFNLADACITIGVLIYILSEFKKK